MFSDPVNANKQASADWDYGYKYGVSFFSVWGLYVGDEGKAWLDFPAKIFISIYDFMNNNLLPANKTTTSKDAYI